MDLGVRFLGIQGLITEPRLERGFNLTSFSQRPKFFRLSRAAPHISALLDPQSLYPSSSVNLSPVPRRQVLNPKPISLLPETNPQVKWGKLISSYGSGFPQAPDGILVEHCQTGIQGLEFEAWLKGRTYSWVPRIRLIFPFC